MMDASFFDQIRKNIEQAGEALRAQANNLGDSAKEKSYALIEEWISSFPKLEAYGLEITSFAFAVALSPGIEVEFKGSHQDFSVDRINTIIKENKGNPVLNTLFTTLRTTYKLHQRIKQDLQDPLIIKVKVRLSPEIKVFIGQPLII